MNRKDREQLRWRIMFELAPGQHTFTMCKCKRQIGCRKGKCWNCLLDELAEGKPSIKEES